MRRVAVEASEAADRAVENIVPILYGIDINGHIHARALP